MPPVKLDVLPLPDLREIDGRVWFKLKLDQKMKWQPDRWLEPARDEDIQPSSPPTTWARSTTALSAFPKSVAAASTTVGARSGKGNGGRRPTVT